ncbi:hypothetical protein LB503_006957 [Fusarium chuoi]|nr:hypothetical protein LB503_006957 [Fusarium chuoi]
MLAIQSMEGPPRPLPGPPPPLVGPEPTEVRQPKPKTLPCKYCSKRFRRVEHVQRHERTHTKEKPFSCGWDRCGKTFGRSFTMAFHQILNKALRIPGLSPELQLAILTCSLMQPSRAQ